jgi:hypothetical protein
VKRGFRTVEAGNWAKCACADLGQCPESIRDVPFTVQATLSSTCSKRFGASPLPRVSKIALICCRMA